MAQELKRQMFGKLFNEQISGSHVNKKVKY